MHRVLGIVDKIGIEPITDVLDVLEKDDKSNVNERVKNYIIDKACESYEVSKSDLSSSYVTGNASDARTTCIILMKNNTSFTHEEIAQEFGKDTHVVVSHALSNYNKKDIKHPLDKKFLERYKHLDIAVSEYKGKLLEGK